MIFLSFTLKTFVKKKPIGFCGNILTTIWKNGGIDKIFYPVSRFDTTQLYLCIVNIKTTQYGTYHQQ